MIILKKETNIQSNKEKKRKKTMSQMRAKKYAALSSSLCGIKYQIGFATDKRRYNAFPVCNAYRCLNVMHAVCIVLCPVCRVCTLCSEIKYTCIV